MKTSTLFARALGGLALALLAAGASLAIDLPKDLPGASDPPFVQRFKGATLVGHGHEDWAQARIPLSATVNANVQGHPFKDLTTVEGSITRAFYLSPEGKSPLEVYRNYEQALNAAGFKKKFACEQNCTDAYFALGKLEVDRGLQWSPGGIPARTGGSYPVDSVMTFEEGRLLVGTLPRGGIDHWVVLYVSKASNDTTAYSQAFVEVVSPKAMTTGQVQVLSAADIRTGLASEGKVAFYGVYFDTGKAQLKPESKAQLDEMAKLLKAQPALKCFVVGHTDGQGQLDANLSLSTQRAEAVVAALTKNYGIEASRLQAQGVASLAPVSTNTTDAGRALNRRVELVQR